MSVSISICPRCGSEVREVSARICCPQCGIIEAYCEDAPRDFCWKK